MKIIKKLRFSRMFIPVVILALFLGTVSVGAGVATVLNLTSNSEETVEPIVYTFDSEDMVKKVGYGFMEYAFENESLKMTCLGTSSHQFAIQSTYPKLGDAFEIGDRKYLKIRYSLSGVPDENQEFGVSLHILAKQDAGAEERYGIDFNINRNALQFSNGDELEIVADMSMHNKIEDAVWVRNISKNQTEYVTLSCADFYDREYKGTITGVDLRLCSAGGTNRTGYAKYFGFFNTLDEALEYPLAEEIAKLRANNTTTIDGSHKTKGHAVEAAEKYIDEAFLGGLVTVTIIHGKGTGVLRKGIHDMLKVNPCVKSYRLGVYGEGETGVTIVELKKR